ncbi:hypothetical protein LSH36_258g01005 [Paralvinella palmiformis]|uniref:C2H2-type domain-containing protein n=1 Tax=Paralvinella palmiformis TaxID=53620 RepID=A0AAD9N2W7_9ANNE|nr:hypothetical protein LSH36_258g01005 [Paralvinella palmiformis]
MEDSNSECKSLSQSQSQNQDGGSIKCDHGSSPNDKDLVLDSSDGVGFTASNCDKITNSVGGMPRSPPNGLMVSSYQFTPTSKLDGSIIPSSCPGNNSSSNSSSNCCSSSGGSSSDHTNSTCNKSFKVSNGAVCNSVITECVNSVNEQSTSSSSSTTATVSSPASSKPSSSLKRPHSPARKFSVHSSGSRPVTVSVTPQKKQRSAYTPARALAASVEVRASMISTPHLALTPNSIPGFAALQPPVHHLPTESASPTNSQVALLRPVLPTHGATSLQSQMPSYGTQYSSVRSYPGALAASPVASYPIQYQPISPSDVTNLQTLRQNLQSSLLSPYYPTTLTTPQIQQPMLTQTATEPLAMTPDLMAANPEVLTSDLTSYLQSSKDMLGQQVSINYANGASTNTGLPPGYQYQALSMQTISPVPKTGVYHPSSSSPFTSTPSPPYLSFSGPKNISAIPTIPVASAMNPTPMMTASSCGQHQMAFGQGRINDSSKLDPVSQAVYDNVLGKLPLKRKKEIPCTMCGLVFNSDAQASAHFAGSKHLKRQKSDDGEQGEESQTGCYQAAGRRISGEIDRICPVLKRISVDTNETRTNSEDGDDKKEIVRIPCDVCGLVFSNEEQAEVHFRGMKHNKRLKLEQTKKEGLPSGVAVKDWGTPFSCILCKTTLNSAEQLEQHLQGKQHRLKQSQQSGFTGSSIAVNNVANTWTEVAGREAGWFYCQTCDISVRTGMCLQRHVQSQKHKDNVAEKHQL